METTDDDERETRDCRPPRGRPRRKPDKTEEGPSPSPSQSTQPAAAVETPAERPSFFGRLAGFFKQRNGTSLREDIADALAETDTDGGSFSPGERAMLNNILRLREVRVEDVMVPRADIEAVEIGTTLGELLTVFEQSGHSRMPVYSETLDDPRGMVHIRDVLAHITSSPASRKAGRRRKAAPRGARPSPTSILTKSIGDLNLIRTVLFVPPSMLASDLMAPDAGDAHPDGAGHRRIWRHRRSRLAGGHRRDGRRRYRGRA